MARSAETQASQTSRVGELVAECFELLEQGVGPEAVERLLEQHSSEAQEVRARLQRLSRLGFLAGDAPAAPALPDRLGSFQLIERLGIGGMGVVYRARDQTLGRDVALKVVRPDLLLFENARTRFQREIEAIARLKHPGILPVYSAGEEGDLPFFAMEYVEGCALSEVLAHLGRSRPGELTAAALSGAIAALSPPAEIPSEGALGQRRFASTWTEACIRLTLSVAEALQHAHERGVLHRDVKPSNVMLTRDGRVLLLDFGLAMRTESSRITQSGSLVGSLPYMAPEQIRGEPIDERADVYSLGLTLYELLTLRCPYLSPNAEVTRRRILEGDAPAIRSLNPQVPWDAETVCLTAMDRDPDRRYASAAAFAADLANFLEHRPIQARRPGLLLRARRFAERHPAGSVAGTLGLLLLLGAAGFGALQLSTNRELRAANHEKSEALSRTIAAFAALETALARKHEINEILRSMIGAPDPMQNQMVAPVARETKVVEVIDQVREVLEGGQVSDPAVEAEVSAVLGETYMNLGMPETSERLLVRALELYRDLQEEDGREAIHAKSQLGGLRYDQRRFDEAIDLLEDAFARCERALSTDDPLTRNVRNDLAVAHHESGNLQRSEELYRRTLEELGDPNGPDEALGVALACHNLGSLLKDRGSLAESAELLERALELRERYLPTGHVRTLATRNELGGLWMMQGRFDEAAPLLEENLAEVERALGDRDDRTLFARVNVAWACVELGRFEEAEEHARFVVEAVSAAPPGPGDPKPLMARVRLAQALAGQGKLVEAAAVCAEAEPYAEGVIERLRATAASVCQKVQQELDRSQAAKARD